MNTESAPLRSEILDLRALSLRNQSGVARSSRICPAQRSAMMVAGSGHRQRGDLSFCTVITPHAITHFFIFL